MKWESKSSVMNTEREQTSNSHQLQDEDCITSCSSSVYRPGELWSERQRKSNHPQSWAQHKGSGRLLQSFPSSSCILSTPSPPLPPVIVHSTDKSTPLHKPSLFNLSLYSCYKTSLQLLGKDLLLPYLFLCRASVDVMVPRGRRGGETASVMRMVAPHWCMCYTMLVCVCAPRLRGRLHDNNLYIQLGCGGRLSFCVSCVLLLPNYMHIVGNKVFLMLSTLPPLSSLPPPPSSSFLLLPPSPLSTGGLPGIPVAVDCVAVCKATWHRHNRNLPLQVSTPYLCEKFRMVAWQHKALWY